MHPKVPNLKTITALREPSLTDAAMIYESKIRVKNAYQIITNKARFQFKQ